MKKLYEKPDVEYIEFIIHDSVMGAFRPSIEIGDDDEEGRTE